MKNYKPPFEMNEQIATLAAEIAELSEKFLYMKV